MIDIHCHILPGIDDGAPDIETSLGMLKMAAADGITHIAATPHFTYSEKPTFEDIKACVKLLSERAKREDIGIKILCGADIRLTYELIHGIQNNDLPAINGSRYFLIELPDLLPPNIEDLIFEAKLKGFIPIITHPERNYSLLSSPDKADPLREAGALFQLTAMSVTGDFGSQIRKLSLFFFKKGFVDFVATDAHNVGRRPPLLSKDYREVSDIYDEKMAKQIFLENPSAVIENREIG